MDDFMPLSFAGLRCGVVAEILLLAACVAGPGLAQQSHLHFGTCDASAVVSVGDDLFLIATDEDNELRLYASDTSSGPLKSFDMSEFLEVDPSEPEADLEAVTLLGDWAIWITSHGRSKNGKKRESRRRLFATIVKRTSDDVTVEPVGKPYKRLIDDLLEAPELSSFKLHEAESRAPTLPAALNIEGLAAGPDGRLWIAFRNPVPEGRALLVPIENPREVIEGGTAKLGPPVQLDLGGLGVRSIEYAADPKLFVIVAGGPADDGEFALFGWPGGANDAPQRLSVDVEPDLTPEAIACYPGSSPLRLLMLSDDGTRKHDGVDCKDLADPARMSFRSTTLRID